MRRENFEYAGRDNLRNALSHHEPGASFMCRLVAMIVVKHSYGVYMR
jgi:hypothetical protein